MESFKIEEHNNKYYVIPTAEYLSNVKVALPMPFDTNFFIYKLFDYEPKEFILFLCGSCEAQVVILKDFPYVNFSFSKYSSAAAFLEIINKRSSNVQEKSV